MRMCFGQHFPGVLVSALPSEERERATRWVRDYARASGRAGLVTGSAGCYCSPAFGRNTSPERRRRRPPRPRGLQICWALASRINSIGTVAKQTNDPMRIRWRFSRFYCFGFGATYAEKKASRWRLTETHDAELGLSQLQSLALTSVRLGDTLFSVMQAAFSGRYGRAEDLRHLGLAAFWRPSQRLWDRMFQRGALFEAARAPGADSVVLRAIFRLGRFLSSKLVSAQSLDVRSGLRNRGLRPRRGLTLLVIVS